jgi:hypothetical protein
MAFPKVDFRGDFLTMLRQAQVTPRDAPIQSRSSVQSHDMLYKTSRDILYTFRACLTRPEERYLIVV